MEQASAEDHLKDMLHALRQLDGSDVLVIQDQMDVTSNIDMQTKVQKLTFEQWGKTLAMDFTHGMNNPEYHLGAFDSLHIATLFLFCSNLIFFPCSDLTNSNQSSIQSSI